MVSELYTFDLESFVWEKLPTSPDGETPRARYFHSADSCKLIPPHIAHVHLSSQGNNKLVIFGGMSNQQDSQNPDELCVLNDVWLFDLATKQWDPATLPSVNSSDLHVPKARYAHLSAVASDRLFIIGGQDFFNNWLDDICAYDLVGKTWIQRRDYPRHCGTYRSVAVSSNMCVRVPQDEESVHTPSTGSSANRFQPVSVNGLSDTSSEKLIQLPYSANPSEDHPSDIYLYSNYNVLSFPSPL